MSFENEMLSLIKKLNLNDHEKAACTIRDECERLDPSNDYLAIVYNPITGWSKHGVSAGYYYNFFRQNGSKGKANIVILYDKKGKVVNDSDITKKYLELRSDVKMDKNAWDEIVDFTKTTMPLTGKYKLLIGSIMSIITNEDFIGAKKVADYVKRHLDKSYKDNKSFLSSWPNEDLSLWDCKRSNGVYGAWTNTDRTIWVVGEEYTMATLKPTD